MSIGGANITAFIGANGPYWTDLDGDHEVSWSDANGNPLTQGDVGSVDGIVDADETEELNENAIGFHVTDLDVGILVMASIDINDLGVFLAADASVHSFGLVGVPLLSASGAFDINLNVGIGIGGAAGFDFDTAVVDFQASFGAGGFQVNTGDPTSPVALDFTEFLISVQLGGIITISDLSGNPVVRLNGLFLFEVDNSGLKAFVAAGLEFRPRYRRRQRGQVFRHQRPGWAGDQRRRLCGRYRYLRFHRCWSGRPVVGCGGSGPTGVQHDGYRPDHHDTGALRSLP